MSDWLTKISFTAIGVGTFAVMFLAAVAGHYYRRWQVAAARRKGRESVESVAQESYLIGSALGLLGLLLAFSFGMVINRYEERRQLVVQEANAIGTSYLRAQLLDEPHRSRLSALLTAYTENRIKLAQSGGGNSDYLAHNNQLLTQIWAAVRAARESALTHGLTTTLLVTYNEVIDLDTERKVAWDLRMPVEVLVLIVVYLAITAGLVGHQVDGPRGRRSALALFVLIALSVTVIADINRPMSGHALESQKPMLMLLQSLRSQPPRAFDKYTTSPAATAGARG